MSSRQTSLSRIVFTGINGVGKTTTIAKLAKYFEKQGYSTVLANGDTYRAGANEQIREHAEALDKKLIAHEQGGDPAAVIYDGVEYAEANDIDVVLGDTAGRLHTSDDLMAQLEKIDRNIDPDIRCSWTRRSQSGRRQPGARVQRCGRNRWGGLIEGRADPQGGATSLSRTSTVEVNLSLGTGQRSTPRPGDPEDSRQTLGEEALRLAVTVAAISGL